MKELLQNKRMTSLISFLISFFFLYIGENFQGFWHQICESVAEIFLVVVPITFLTSWVSDKSMANLIKNILPICNDCQKYGLMNIFDAFPLGQKEFQNEFVHSKTFYLVMNDGKQFLSNNNELFNERLNERNEVNVILLDYENDDLMKILTNKNEHSGDYYKDKIKNVIGYHLKRNDIHVYLNSFYNTMAILVTDNYAIISLYREALGKGRVPHFVFKNNGDDCEYRRILDDVKKLCDRSKRIIVDDLGRIEEN